MIKNSEKVVNCKNQLLEMARNNEPRPSRKSQLGMKLGNYINKTGGSYDPDFAQKIRELRPDWFNYASKVGEKKQKLLEIAAIENSPRPKGELKNSLSSYTVRGGSYDAEFDEKIRAMRPDWFVEGAKKNPPHVIERKKLLLEMARNNDRPITIDNRRHPLSMSLYNYTHKKGNAYDPQFDAEIRAIRPEWFLRRDTQRIVREHRTKRMSRKSIPEKKAG